MDGVVSTDQVDGLPPTAADSSDITTDSPTESFEKDDVKKSKSTKKKDNEKIEILASKSLSGEDSFDKEVLTPKKSARSEARE